MFDDDTRDACVNEVQLLKTFAHPNIVRFIEAFLSRKRDALCIVMSYCEGGDLDGYIRTKKRQQRGNQVNTKGSLDEKEILYIFAQVALGLHHMHQHNILHRDIKVRISFLHQKA